MIIKGTHFDGVKAIKRAVTMELRGIPEKILPAVHKSVLEKYKKMPLDLTGVTLNFVVRN